MNPRETQRVDSVVHVLVVSLTPLVPLSLSRPPPQDSQDLPTVWLWVSAYAPIQLLDESLHGPFDDYSARLWFQNAL